MTSPLNPSTPHQIGDVVGVDRMDVLDRQRLDPRIKLQLLQAEARVTHGRDPAAGGFVIVGRPRVLLQLLLDVGAHALSADVRLHRAVVIGSRDGDADVVASWREIPIVVRSSVVDDRLWCVPRERVPPSTMTDRQRAGQLRMSAHGGPERLALLREDS